MKGDKERNPVQDYFYFLIHLVHFHNMVETEFNLIVTFTNKSRKALLKKKVVSSFYCQKVKYILFLQQLLVLTKFWV